MCLAIPGLLTAINGDEALFRTGIVDFGGIRKSVSLACLPEANPGDYVIVHAGIAISIVDPIEVEQVFRLIDSFDEQSEQSALERQDKP